MDEVEPDDASKHRARRSELFRAAHKRLDPIDGPRALGAKRLALQAQKRRQAIVDWPVGLLKVREGSANLLISRNGTLAFAIHRGTTGLFVEKRCCTGAGPHISQLMVFRSLSTFDLWCDIEPTRFDDPLLCDKLRRRGHELFATCG